MAYDLPHLDPFTLGLVDFTDARAESPAVRRKAKQELWKAAQSFPIETMCSNPTVYGEILEARLARLSRQAQKESELQRLQAMRDSLVQESDYQGDHAPTFWVGRINQQIRGGWGWFGIKILGRIGGVAQVSARPFPIIPELSGARLGRRAVALGAAFLKTTWSRFGRAVTCPGPGPNTRKTRRHTPR
jgi:hypothetical protein